MRRHSADRNFAPLHAARRCASTAAWPTMVGTGVGGRLGAPVGLRDPMANIMPLVLEAVQWWSVTRKASTENSPWPKAERSTLRDVPWATITERSMMRPVSEAGVSSEIS